MTDKRNQCSIPTKQEQDKREAERRKLLRRQFEVFYLGWTARAQRINGLAPPPYNNDKERSFWRDGWRARQQFELKELEDSEIFRELLVKEEAS